MNKEITMPSASSGGRKNNQKKKLRNDIIFIGAMLALVVLAGLVFFYLRGEGDRVAVSVDGEEIGVYPLSRDTEVDIRTGKDGAQLNRLIIKDGEAWISEATCPDGICAAHRPIHRDGESIVCLPHKVVVTVRETDN